MNDLEHELRRRVEGDVRFDTYSRLLYSTDASMYQMEPIGVVIPRHAGDVQAAVEIANQQGVPLLPRGGGTSLTGQTVNRAVVLDFSRHMGGVLEVNREELWARVQPGLVQDELNHHVRPLGLLFGPDTSTSNRATLGGMIGNNSGGSHSIAYGLTVEHVIEIQAVLADGSRATFGEVTPDAVRGQDARCPASRARSTARSTASAPSTTRRSGTRYPRHWRRVCGYNLDELVKDRPLNMARLIVGSEGTFLTVVEAKVRLVRKPKATALDVIHYHDMQEALESSQAILETGPYAVELTDKMILDLARNNIEQSQRMGFVQGDPAAILIVEYAGDTEQEVKAKVADLEARRSRGRFGYASHIAADSAEQQSIWKLRKAGLGLLLGTRGESKPIAFIEDTAVDPKHLPEFVPRFTEIMAKHGADAAYYGHCSVGCLHIRPLINLKTERGLEQVRVMAEEIFDLVLSFGGAISSEHGDGRARSPFLERVFGATMFRAFRETKAAFDPRGLMNPGNIVGSPGVTEHLRYGPDLQDVGAQDPARLQRAGRLHRGGGDVQRGRRLPQEARGHHVPVVHGHPRRGALDPRPRQRAARGALRQGAGGRLRGPAPLRGDGPLPRVQGLQGGVPVQRGHGQDEVRVPAPLLLGERAARCGTGSSATSRSSPGSARAWPRSRTGSRAPGRTAGSWSGWPASTGAGRCPRFARETFTDWFDARRAPREAPRGDVVLFHDTFVTYNAPEIGRAAVELLEAGGYRVQLVDKKCCGRPLISKGMLDEAKAHAEWNVARLHPWVARGAAIVGLEPSCLLTLRDETVELVRTDEARQVAAASFLLEEFLLREKARGLTLPFRPPLPGGARRQALLHGHCHQKAMVGTAPTVAALRWAGFDVAEVDSGCCGMAGSFGFEREHYDLSVSLGNRRLAPAVKSAAVETEIVAPGVSCRQQIEHLAGRPARHPAQVLRDALSS